MKEFANAYFLSLFFCIFLSVFSIEFHAVVADDAAEVTQSDALFFSTKTKHGKLGYEDKNPTQHTENYHLSISDVGKKMIETVVNQNKPENNLFVDSSSSPPSPPMWPSYFDKLFMEITMYPTSGRHATIGKYEYNFDEKKEMILRMNGRYNPVCGINGKMTSVDTPCAHAIMNNNRYLIYPEKKECCFCCDAAHMCGLVKPDWLSNSTFVRELHFKMNNSNVLRANMWLKKGIPPYLYLEDADERENENGKREKEEFLYSNKKEGGEKEPIVLYKVPHVLQVFKNKKNDEEITFEGMSELERENMCKLKEYEKLVKDIIYANNVPSWCKLDSPCSKMSVCNMIQSHNVSNPRNYFHPMEGEDDIFMDDNYHYLVPHNDEQNKKEKKLHEDENPKKQLSYHNSGEQSNADDDDDDADDVDDDDDEGKMEDNDVEDASQYDGGEGKNKKNKKPRQKETSILEEGNVQWNAPDHIYSLLTTQTDDKRGDENTPMHLFSLPPTNLSVKEIVKYFEELNKDAEKMRIEDNKNSHIHNNYQKIENEQNKQESTEHAGLFEM